MAEEEQIKDTQSDPLPPLENIYFLMIKVISASDLMRADFTGSSDPFCRVIANKQSWSTQPIMKNLNPEWNEETQFVFFEAVEEICFEVYDWDKGSKHDQIGTAKLNVKAFYEDNNQGYDGDLELKNCKKGSIKVCVTGRTVKPLELEQRCVSLEAECKKQAEEIRYKNEECQKLMAKNADYAQQKNDLLEKQKELSDKYKNLERSIEACNEENARKEEKCKRLKKKRDEYNAKIYAKQQDIDKKKENYKAEQRKLQDAEDEYQSLQKTAKEKRDEYNQGYGYKVKDDNNYNKTSSKNTSDLNEPLLNY